MRANIVLSGGGVKGAVLAGCLKAVQDKGIVPVGVGGTSAGSIVATLASIGYSADEIKAIMIGMDFKSLLDDGGVRMSQLCSSASALHTKLKEKAWFIGWALSNFVAVFNGQFGLYNGSMLKKTVNNLIRSKIKDPPQEDSDITFQLLRDRNCLPLKIVATDFTSKKAVIFGNGGDSSQVAVADAVLASSSFPFIFMPAQISGQKLVDGGLSSNLPSFLFEEEYRQSRTPTFAFDLIGYPKNQEHDIIDYIKDLYDSALTASDILLRESTPGVSYFPVEVPPGIGTFSFAMKPKDSEACFYKGYSEAATQLETHESILRRALSTEDLQKSMILRYGPKKLYEPILAAVALQMEKVTNVPVANMRSHIMLLTGRPSSTAESTRIVTYAYGMDNDPDRDLEIDQDAGCSGQAWESESVAVADLDEARKNPSFWKMTGVQHDKVPNRVKSMISVPIFGSVKDPISPLPPIGTLSVDLTVPLDKAGWGERTTDDSWVVPRDVDELLRGWAFVIGAILP